jgi:protein-tyrosine-phosphatase
MAGRGLGEWWRQLRRSIWVLRQLPHPARRGALGRWLETPTQRESRLRSALAQPRPRLLFVCHGNIMRSAFAQAHARAVAQVNSAPLAERIDGAGTHATAGAPAHPDAITAASTLGVSLTGHRARPLGTVAAAGGLLVVCLDRAKEARAMVWAGEHAHRVFLIGDAAGGDSREVLDPYGHGPATAERAFERVRAHVDTWLDRLGHCQETPSRSRH